MRFLPLLWLIRFTVGSYNCTCDQGFAGNGYTSCTGTISTLRRTKTDAHLYSDVHTLTLDTNAHVLNKQKYADTRSHSPNAPHILTQTHTHIHTYTQMHMISHTHIAKKPLSYALSQKCNAQRNLTTVFPKTDIDECAQGTFSCPANSYCVNTIGSYTCQCDLGTVKTGSQCVATNPCLVQFQRNCSQYATCTQTSGNVNCTCNSGYQGDGFTCSKCT